MESQNRYITPTLQANFNLAIGEVIKRLNEDDIYSSWLACKTLYHILPPKVHESINGKFKQITEELGKVDITNTNSYEGLTSIHENMLLILQNHVESFFREMYRLLYEGGYLEKRQKEIETNAPPALLEQ